MSAHIDGGSGIFSLSINPSCTVFNGHFPSQAVCPGVCGIELVREYAGRIVGGSLRITSISKCRFTAILRPGAERLLFLNVSAVPLVPGGSVYAVEATMSGRAVSYMSLRGEMSMI